MKGLIGSVVVNLLAASLVFFVVYSGFNRIKDIDSRYKEKVGEEVLFRGDTLMVIDYSIWEESFVLEDGREVAFELVEGLEVLEHNK